MNKKFFLFSLMIAMMFLFKNGYQFNQSDQEEHLPQVYQQLEPALYSGDFFVNSWHETFTVREYYVGLVGTLAKVVPLDLLCFILQLLCTSLAVFALMRITERFGGTGIAPFVTAALAVLFLNNWTVGGNTFESNILIGTSIANPFVMFSILFFLQGRNFTAGSFAGIATLFQALMGLHVFLLLLFALFIIGKRKKFRKLLLLFAGYVIFSAAMMVPLLMRQFDPLMDYDLALYYQLLYEFRNYLHYVPSLFPVDHYIKLGGLVIAAYFVSRWVFLKKRRFLYAFSGGILGGLLVYYLLFEVAGWMTLGKLQWFKTTVLLNTICCVLLGLGAGAAFNNKVRPLRLARLISPIAAFGILVFAIPVLFSASLPIEKIQGRYKIGNYAKSDLQLMHEYIAANTDVNAVILTSPDNDSFLCEAKRSSPFSYKAMVHEPFYILEWFDRASALFGSKLEHAGSVVEEASEAYHNQLYADPENPYNIDYRLIDMSKCSYLSLLQDVIYVQGNFGLFPYDPAE